MKKLHISLVSLLACVFGEAIIATLPPIAAQVSSLKEFALNPRLSISGVTGNYTIGKGQALFPLYGDQTQALYGIAEGSIASGNSGWFAGAGLGYRKVIDNNKILGGYFIMDRTISPEKNAFWIANPGVEIMGKDWDVNCNVYLPLRYSKDTYKTVKWAEEFGIHTFTQYKEHYGYDRYMQRTDYEAVSRGVDLRVGKTIPNFDKAKIYLGGYYFKAADAGQINGVLTKLSYELNKYTSVELTNTYDNYNHNKFLFGLKLTLGGYNEQEKKDFGIANRLLDPIEHGYIDTIVPIKKITGTPELIGEGPLTRYDNLWFFTSPATAKTRSNNNGLNDPNALAEDGTYEHSFTTLDANAWAYVEQHKNIGIITKYPMIYIAPGTYDLSDAGFPGDVMALASGWGIYGRNANFTQPASIAERPTLQGFIRLVSPAPSADNSNYLESIVISRPTDVETGTHSLLYLENAQNVTLHNVKIGANTIEGGGDIVGVQMINSSINLNGVDIGAVVKTASSITTNGIDATNSQINFIGDDVNTTNVIKVSVIPAPMASNSNAVINANGIKAVHTDVNFKSANNNIEANVNFPYAQSMDFITSGINASNSSNVVFDGNSVNNVEATSKGLELGATARSYGVYLSDSTLQFNGGEKNDIYAYASVDNMPMSQGKFNKVTTDSENISAGIYAEKDHPSRIDFDGGKINNVTGVIETSSGTDISGYGILAQSAEVNFSNDSGINNIAGKSTNSYENYVSETFGYDAAGISASYGSTINILKGANNISATSKSAYQSLSVTASGIVMPSINNADKNTLNISGGATSIDASVSDKGGAYGIHDQDGRSTIKFTAGGSGSTSISLKDLDGGTDYAAFGISASNNTEIWNGATKLTYDNVTEQSLNDLLRNQNISINAIGGKPSIDGKKISWWTDKGLDW